MRAVAIVGWSRIERRAQGDFKEKPKLHQPRWRRACPPRRGAEFRRCSTSTHHPQLNPEFCPLNITIAQPSPSSHPSPITTITITIIAITHYTNATLRSTTHCQHEVPAILGLYCLAIVVLALCAAVSAQNPLRRHRHQRPQMLKQVVVVSSNACMVKSWRPH